MPGFSRQINRFQIALLRRQKAHQSGWLFGIDFPSLTVPALGSLEVLIPSRQHCSSFESGDVLRRIFMAGKLIVYVSLQHWLNLSRSL